MKTCKNCGADVVVSINGVTSPAAPGCGRPFVEHTFACGGCVAEEKGKEEEVIGCSPPSFVIHASAMRFRNNPTVFKILLEASTTKACDEYEEERYKEQGA